jgi:hypothetical protein
LRRARGRIAADSGSGGAAPPAALRRLRAAIAGAPPWWKDEAMETGADSEVRAVAQGRATATFTREELSRILNVYGQFVAAGEWRDYAIDHLRDAAVFSVFRRASENPIYRIEKRPKLAARQGQYMVVAMTGLILKRGHDLAQVLRVFDKQKLKLAE